jgi:TnpA family transposase
METLSGIGFRDFREDQEISMLSLYLLQNSIAHINTLLI